MGSGVFQIPEHICKYGRKKLGRLGGNPAKIRQYLASVRVAIDLVAKAFARGMSM